MSTSDVSALERTGRTRALGHAPAFVIEFARTRASRTNRSVAAGSSQVAGCRAHANGARLPSVHMQTSKFGDSLARAAEARRVLGLQVIEQTLVCPADL
jgi:hypothetical protein